MRAPCLAGFLAGLFAGFLASLSVLLTLLPSAALAQASGGAAFRVPDTMAQRVLACTPCHGREGRATPDGYYPRIAGKPAGYLYHQLVHFREGERRNAAMAHLLAQLDDAYLREIAAHFAALDLPYPPPAPAAAGADLKRGEALVKSGDRARGLPACNACHGERMTGVLPATPGLLGLPRDYLVGQLGAWQNGKRRAKAPDCMAEIAKKLGAEDLGAVASWLAAQPVPADAKPAAAISLPLPVECGSVAP